MSRWIIGLIGVCFLMNCRWANIVATINTIHLLFVSLSLNPRSILSSSWSLGKPLILWNCFGLFFLGLTLSSMSFYASVIHLQIQILCQHFLFALNKIKSKWNCFDDMIRSLDILLYLFYNFISWSFIYKYPNSYKIYFNC